MRVLITGATGFIGRALVLRLLRDGHQVVAWVRSESAAKAKLGANVELLSPGSGGDLGAAARGADAVINLAGEPVVGHRWTAARKKALAVSRVELTRALAQGLRAGPGRCKVLLSGSAVGYYGDRGEERLDETSAPGEGFLAELCRGWEAAALEAEGAGVRVALVRIGIVLGDGGALAQMLPIFRAGAGGPLGSGRQYMPWIHLDDLLEVFVRGLEDPAIRGPVNGTAPEPVPNRTFAKVLGKVLGRPALLPAPAFALRALFGEAATAILGGQRVMPAKLERLGFAFRFGELEGALRDLLGKPPDVRITTIPKAPEDPLPPELGASVPQAGREGVQPAEVGEDHHTLDATRGAAPA